MSEKDISEINIIYNIKGENKIRIFGDDFVKNNRNIIRIIYFLTNINYYFYKTW